MMHLTKRETEVLGFLRTGLRDQEIGDKLGISPHTVKKYLVAIRGKIGLRNRTELCGWAINNSH